MGKLRERLEQTQAGVCYHGQSGISRAVVEWNQTNINDSLASPGDSLVRPWRALDNGCSYSVVVHRIDGGDTSERLYSITSTGRGPGDVPGQRQISAMVKAPSVLPNNALTFGNDVQISGNPTLTGTCSNIHFSGGQYWGAGAWRSLSDIGWKHSSGTYTTDNAEGDVKLNGAPSGGEGNFQGVIYAGAQCEVSGAPNIHGQLICRDDPDPAGSENWVSNTKISGNLTLDFDCSLSSLSTKPTAISGRSWTQIWR